MYFDDNFLELVNESNPLFDLLCQYMDFKDHGETYRAVCCLPGHMGDSDPSFTYFKRNDTAYCFGCNTNIGDSIDFLREMEGMGFHQAVLYLANRAGLELPDQGIEDEVKKNNNLREKMLNKAREFWSNLMKNDNYKFARDYLRSRGITEELINKFRLGYCQYDKDKRYKKFTHRIMFPIFDEYDRMMGFAGRKLPDAEEKYVKYVNSSQEDIPFFDKGNIVYGLNLAKKAIIKTGFAFWFEGYTDVILAHKYNVENAIACMGTAITQQQIKKLSHYTDEVILFMDSDDPGEKAMKRSIKMFDEYGITLKMVKDSTGKDPAEKFAEIEEDFEDWAVRNAKTPEQFYIDKHLNNYYTEINGAKRNLIKKISDSFGDRLDKIETEFALSSVCHALDINLDSLKKHLINHN